MFRPLPLYIALRYVTTRRANRFASFVSWVSLAGIGLGVAALIIVLSVMNGFEREVIRHLLGMSSHAVILPRDGSIADWPAVLERLRGDARVIDAAPYVRGSGMVTRRGQVTGAFVEGIDVERERRVTEIEHYVPAGALRAIAHDGDGVLLGDSLARNVSAAPGDTITLVVPQWNAAGNAIAPRYVRLKVKGTFHTGMHQFDARLVLTHIDSARRAFGFGERISGVRTRLRDPIMAANFARDIGGLLGDAYRAVDWTQYERNFFLALQSQKRIMFVILILIIAVAAFNVAANMIMMVTEKMRDISILRTIGASRSHIVLTFLAQGLLLGVAGAALGVALGAWGAHESQSVAAVLERLTGIDLLNADVYYLDYLPAEVRAGDVASVAAAALILALLATLYPALRAARIEPARGVHIE